MLPDDNGAGELGARVDDNVEEEQVSLNRSPMVDLNNGNSYRSQPKGSCVTRSKRCWRHVIDKASASKQVKRKSTDTEAEAFNEEPQRKIVRIIRK